MTLIKLDYDKITTRDIWLIFYYRGFLIKHLGTKSIRCYETKRGYHVRINTVKKLKPVDVQMVQLLMGSDIHREIYNFLRRLDGRLINEWNKLYTKKYLILGTQIKDELSSEKYCKVLQQRVEDAIKESKDLEGFI